MTFDNDNEGGGVAGAKLLEDGLLDSGMSVGTGEVPRWYRWQAILFMVLLVGSYLQAWISYRAMILADPKATWGIGIASLMLLALLTVTARGLYRYASWGWYLALGLFVFQAMGIPSLLLSYLVIGPVLNPADFLTLPVVRNVIVATLTGWVPLIILLLGAGRAAFKVSTTGIFWTVLVGTGMQLLLVVARYFQI